MSRKAGKTYKYWWLSGAAKFAGVDRRGVISLARANLERGNIVAVRKVLYEYVDFDQTPQGFEKWVRSLSPADDATGLVVAIMLQELEDTLHQRGKPKRVRR